MKRIMLAGLLIALCAGCAPGARILEATPPPTPAPTPVPPPVIAVLGGAEETGFLDMVRSIAESAACDFIWLDADGLERWRPEGPAALILYLEEDVPKAAQLEALAARDILLYAYAAVGQALPDGLHGLVYDPSSAAEKALDEAIYYDNHDTPVRLLGLFSAEDSGAAAAWTEAVEAGRVLNKGAYYEEDAEKSAEEWLSGRLAGLYPGMLDGLYCESAELARTAAALITKQARGDMEVFCAAADGALLAGMQHAAAPVVRATGAEPREAGRLCAEQAIVLLYGGTAERLTIAPSVFAAS